MKKCENCMEWERFDGYGYGCFCMKTMTPIDAEKCEFYADKRCLDVPHSWKPSKETVNTQEIKEELQKMTRKTAKTIADYSDHCGNCAVIDYCDEPYSDIHLCCNPVICDMSPTEFKELYNNIQYKHPKWSKRKILKFLTDAYGAEDALNSVRDMIKNYCPNCGSRNE
ncbi:hypothetical protein [Eubacterium oxidoreducens]|uniref:Uncharacterized protein n=1 Tax=Eubacterium oxidoreducens TaxID=1732 RepID=A0A1G6B2G0_EUBOX|nr:hypothetical protein [Eubacterium oxidoreducens]SDB14850.1 hypothetical protein SAMN02910417_01085 [Eubacterium oxidoreducens]